MCDFVEYYQIFNIYDYDLSFIVALFFGLREDSRIKKKLFDINFTVQELLLARVVDGLQMILYLDAKKYAKNKNQVKMPLSIYEEMINIGKNKSNDDDLMTFESGEDFKIFILNKQKERAD